MAPSSAARLISTSLQEALTRAAGEGAGGEARLAVVGIGNELRGDDAAGIVVARELAARMGNRPGVLVIDAGPVPENHTGPLRRFAPGLVLLVDAAQLGGAPGELRWLAWQETDGLSASTHSLPPYVLASYLTSELGCDVALLGIQPAGNEFDTPLSPEVRRAVDEVVNAVLAAL